VPAERHRPNHVFYAFAPSLPDRDAPPLGEVLEYRQLSNHPELQSVANQREVSADGRRVQAFDMLYLSGAHLESCYWQFDGPENPQPL
jgi:hypothetical protein